MEKMLLRMVACDGAFTRPIVMLDPSEAVVRVGEISNVVILGSRPKVPPNCNQG